MIMIISNFDYLLFRFLFLWCIYYIIIYTVSSQDHRFPGFAVLLLYCPFFKKVLNSSNLFFINCTFSAKKQYKILIFNIYIHERSAYKIEKVLFIFSETRIKSRFLAVFLTLQCQNFLQLYFVFLWFLEFFLQLYFVFFYPWNIIANFKKYFSFLLQHLLIIDFFYGIINIYKEIKLIERMILKCQINWMIEANSLQLI